MTSFGFSSIDPALAATDTKTAMDMIASAKQYFVAYGRFVAVQICMHKQKKGEKATVHSREVRDEMEKRGILAGYTGADYWLGAVFNGGPFEKTGDHFSYSDPSRGIHQRTVTVWRLKPGAGAAAFIEPVMPQEIKDRIERFNKMENSSGT